MPSSDRSVNDIRYSSFSQPKIEKSDSTVAVFAKIVAIPPQKSRNALNRPSTTPQAASKDVLWSHSLSADLREGSFWYARTSLLCCCSILAIDSSLQNRRNWLMCTARMSPNVLPRIFASWWGSVGGKSSEALLLLFLSAWISRMPSTTSRTSCPTLVARHRWLNWVACAFKFYRWNLKSCMLLTYKAAPDSWMNSKSPPYSATILDAILPKSGFYSRVATFKEAWTNATEAPSDHAILHEDGAIARVHIFS